METKPTIFQHPELDGKSFFLNGSEGNNIGLLFLHGFTATTVEVRQIANHFNSIGYTVMGPLLPGHGTSPQDMNKKLLKDWIDTVENAFQTLKKTTPRVCIFGESMGALLSFLLASRHPEIENLFIFSPALKIDGLWKSNLAWPFISFVYKKNTDDTMLWQGYNVVPLHAATQLLRLQRMVKQTLPKITTSTLIFQGKKDKTINPLGTIKAYNLIGSREKELIWLEDSSHCILLDKELPKVVEICTAHLKSIQ